MDLTAAGAGADLTAVPRGRDRPGGDHEPGGHRDPQQHLTEPLQPRRIEGIRPDGTRTATRFDAVGRLERVEEPDAGVTTYA